VAHLDCLPCGCPMREYGSRKAGGYALTRCTYVPRCRLGTHAHADDRIVLTLAGEFRSSYSHRSYELGRFRAIFRPAGIHHRDAYDRETVCISIRLPGGESRGSDTYDFFDDDLAGAAGSLSAEMDATDATSSLVIECLSAEIAARVRSAGKAWGARCGWIRRIRERLEDEYADPPSLQTIAADVGRDESHVATTYKKAFGRSIGEHVRELRLWRVRRLVEDASVSLVEVAQIAGFSDQSHFGRLFKKRFSMTPGEYRRRAMSR
jgi:AraC family transcriptional regulator